VLFAKRLAMSDRCRRPAKRLQAPMVNSASRVDAAGDSRSILCGVNNGPMFDARCNAPMQ